jgi:hypothetical protein
MWTKPFPDAWLEPNPLSETLSSVCTLFAWKTENVVYEFLVKSISC